MGRAREYIECNGRKLWTLFDTGSRNTYITGKSSQDTEKVNLSVPRKIALGGGAHTIEKICILKVKIKDLPMEVKAYIIDEIGEDEDGKEIDVLFGAIAMQEWGIVVIPEDERVDIPKYPKEFVEYVCSDRG